MMARLFAVLGLLLVLGAPAFAVNPNEILPDARLEARARSISAELRCLVCQNQSIDDSDADLAHDLRLLVRERLTAGDSDDQVRQFLVARYGEFVLLRPVLALHTILLWATAPVLLLIGLVAIVVAARRRKAPTPTELSAEEQAALAALHGPHER
ncbi:cytochrome c-type biogenesis protein [Devosia sp.]|uniref:cytochrome c-type biogenesis protein n=1 Tax=Devosia sp. TaxID=1871048 RepID=UPI0032673E33